MYYMTAYYMPAYYMHPRLLEATVGVDTIFLFFGLFLGDKTPESFSYMPKSLAQMKVAHKESLSGILVGTAVQWRTNLPSHWIMVPWFSSTATPVLTSPVGNTKVREQEVPVVSVRVSPVVPSVP